MQDSILGGLKKKPYMKKKSELFKREYMKLFI